MAIDRDIVERLLEGRDPQELFSKGGLFDDLKKALSERILDAELDVHLADEREQGASNGTVRFFVLRPVSLTV